MLLEHIILISFMWLKEITYGFKLMREGLWCIYCVHLTCIELIFQNHFPVWSRIRLVNRENWGPFGKQKRRGSLAYTQKAAVGTRYSCTPCTELEIFGVTSEVLLDLLFSLEILRKGHSSLFTRASGKLRHWRQKLEDWRSLLWKTDVGSCIPADLISSSWIPLWPFFFPVPINLPFLMAGIVQK